MIENKFTYCNPLPIPNVGRGIAYKRQKGVKDYREIADPAVIYENGKWYMYPSCDMAYVSSDFINWEYVKVDIPIAHNYAPAIAKYNGKFYLCSCGVELYRGDTPLGPWECIGKFHDQDGNIKNLDDPALYGEDGKGLFVYYGCGDTIFGARLDDYDSTKLLSPIKSLIVFNPENEWECCGEYNQITTRAWTEGSWMYHKNGKYYLVYSSAGTQYSSYAMGVYVASEPLGEFKYQDFNPILSGKDGYVKGAGHGCIVDGPNGTIWAFYTSILGAYHMYERRIGMDRAYIDESGTLFVSGPTGKPQTAPLYSDEIKTDLKPLSALCSNIEVSSSIEGREGMYAVDESTFSWWQPKSDDKSPFIKLNLSEEFSVSSFRVVWREVGLDYEKGITPKPKRYVLYGKGNVDKDFKVLFDGSKINDELCVDYREIDAKNIKEVKLEILNDEDSICLGIIDFTVFGKYIKRER